MAQHISAMLLSPMEKATEKVEPLLDAPTVVDAPALPNPRERPSSRAPTGTPLGSTSPPAFTKEPSREGTGSGSTRGTSVVTPRETLHLQEITRTRAFVRLAFALAVLTALSMLVLGGDPTAKAVYLAGALAVMASCAWLGWTIREDVGYTIGRALVCGFACIFAAFAGIYFFGVFSPAPMIIPFGLCVFGTSLSDRGTMAVYLTCAISEAALTLAVMANVLPDHGLVRGDVLSFVQRLTILGIIEGIFFATFYISRASRNATLYAIEQHDLVLRGMAQREALLKEARQDLAQAIGAGGRGRYTDQVIDCFRLGAIIGRGAMGEVYEATHVDNGEPAAVKLLLEHVMAQPEHVQRFYREAKIVSSLNVANVVRVLAVADRTAPIPYIAMERLVGQDLSDYLREHKRLSTSGVLNLVRQVGVGLEAARAQGIVHRDLKPRNIYLARYPMSSGARAETRKELWKILDFGVCKLTSEDATLTRSRMVGTPSYMAPEQIAGGPITHRTDLFALGAITYRALTGRPAFAGDVEAEILHKVLHVMPPAPSTLVPTLCAEVDLVMAIALAKDSEARFDSPVELATALDAAIKGHLDPSVVTRGAHLLSRHPWGNG